MFANTDFFLKKLKQDFTLIFCLILKICGFFRQFKNNMGTQFIKTCVLLEKCHVLPNPVKSPSKDTVDIFSKNYEDRQLPTKIYEYRQLCFMRIDNFKKKL